jgi:hypothetical protein
MSSQKPEPIASEVDILKTKAAAKRGVGAVDGKTETIWPKPEFVCPLFADSCTSKISDAHATISLLSSREADEQGASTKIEYITKAGKEASGFTIPAGSMFPLGCAIPNHTTLQHGMYFPPGSMVRSSGRTGKGRSSFMIVP